MDQRPLRTAPDGSGDSTRAGPLARFVFYKVMELQDTIFFIDDKIHCFWDKDPIETNLEFIDRFDDQDLESYILTRAKRWAPG